MTAKINLLLFILLFSLVINTEASHSIMSGASLCHHSLIDISSTVLLSQDTATNKSNSKHVVHGSIIALNTKQLQLINSSTVNAVSKYIDLIENVFNDQVKRQTIKPGATTTRPDNKQTSAEGVDWSMINNLSHIKEAKSLFE